MKTILVTAAVNVELSLLVRDMGAVKRPVRGIPALYELETSDKRVILAETGMGKANAALCCVSLVRAFSPDILISTGCAGAYGTSGLSVGDIVASSSEIYGDEGVLTPSGWQPLEYIGIPLAEVDGKRYFNEIPLSQSMVSEALMFAETVGLPLRAGKFVTVSTGSGTTARGNELSSRFDAICESMEGAAVAHVALMYGLDCLEVRGISNMVEDRDLSRWNVVDAVEKAQRFLHEFIDIL
jgi:futalosine hydrolase